MEERNHGGLDSARHRPVRDAYFKAATRPCMLCGDSRTRPALSHGHYSYVRCSGCGLLAVQPFPEPPELLAVYDDPGDPAVDPSRDPSGEAAVHRMRFSEELDRIEAFCPRGTVLDIGCAWGFFLALCRERGWEAKGVDLSHVQADYARRRFGLDVFTGSLRAARFPDGCFDVVTLWHVFEHFHDPLAELLEVRRILKRDGTVVIAVPTPNSAADYVFQSLPLHLYYYDEGTLSRALGRAGFRVAKIGRGGGTGVASLIRKVGVDDPRKLIGSHLAFLWKAKKIVQRARCLASVHKEITVYAVPAGTF